MKRPFLIALALLLGESARAATPIAIRNPSFEAVHTLAEGGFVGADIPEWEDRVPATAAAGVFNPDLPLNFAPDGQNVLFFNGGGQVNQDLRFADASPVPARPRAVVRVDFQGRPRLDGTAQAQFRLRTPAGTDLLPSPVTISLAANTNGYTTLRADLTLPGADALGANLGQPLVLHVSNPSGAQVNLDTFSATFIPAAEILSFTSSPDRITTPGGSSALAWSVTHATSVTLNGLPVATAGTTNVTPAVTTEYTLRAEGEAGIDVARAVVTVVATNTLRISEFMAANVSILADGDGLFSDWVEIHNPTAVPLSTAGYHLTDERANPLKWPFPSRVIPAGGHLLVFCSGRLETTYVDGGNHPHTNFRLADEGEYLALFAPGGQVATEFSPAYPAQFPNGSHGTGTFASPTPMRLAGGAGASIHYLVPTTEPGAWTAPAFDDSAWTASTLPMYVNALTGPVATAYSLPAATTGNQNFGGALGMDFDVTTPVTISELGVFDAGGNGISGTLTAELWARNNGGTPAVHTDDTAGALLASATFTAAEGTLVGAHRFKTIIPLALNPGSYTIVAHGYNAAELNYNRTPECATDGNAGALTFVRSRFGTAGQWPATPDGRVAQYGAGSFRYQNGHDSSSVSGMFGVNASVLTRLPFAYTNGTAAALTLHVEHDDGFLAWLNGTEVARANAPAGLAFDSAAPSAMRTITRIDLSAHLNLLQNGTNLLAFQGLNVAVSDPDFLLSARLDFHPTVTGPAWFATPTPGAPNGKGQSGAGVLINEINYDPPNGANVPLEFVELHNPGDVAVDLGDWSFGGVTYAFAPGTLLPPRSFVVVAESPSVLSNTYGVASFGPWTGSLSKDGETVELRNAATQTVDRVSYRAGFPWPTAANEPTRSIQLVHPGLDNDLGGAWRAATPTPGQPNSVASDAPPPLVRQVNHTPEQPASGQPVTVTARITDAEDVAAVSLEYQVVEPGAYTRLTDPTFTAPWEPLTMRDDGTAGDLLDADDTWTAVIPGSVQQHRRLVRYRIRAVDGGGAAVTVPVSSEPSPNFAFFCYDGVPAWTAAVQPGVTAAETFSTNTLRKVRAWHLLSRPEDVQDCQYNAATNDGTFRFEGALVVNGRVHDHVRYRVKGQGSTFNTGKNKWKFKFNPGALLDLPSDAGGTTTPVETLNLSSLSAGWGPWNRGLAGLDEAMQFRLTQLAGVDAPRNTFLQFRVIDGAAEAPASQYDGDFWGLYLAFENQDNRFKDAHDLPDGNIFRMQSGATHLLDQGRGQPGDLSDVNAFTTGYNTANQTEAWFRANVDLVKYFSWRAVNEAVNNTDIRDRENVVYFRDPASGRWHLQPWDCDLLYEQLDRWGPQATQATVAYEQIRRALGHPSIRIEFQNRARELQDLLLNSDQSWKLVDEIVSTTTDEPARVIPNGEPLNPGLVEADRRRWDYWPLNPVPPRSNGAFGNYYKTPYPIPDMGLGPAQPFHRVLASADFAGQVKWVKDFIATDAHGGARLAQMIAGQVDPITLALTGITVQIPDTPTLTDLSDPGHPTNRLRFQTSAFSSPNGQDFAALQWRIARCAWPGLAGFTPGQPWRYEVQDTWRSGEITSFASTVDIPAQNLESGASYRVRVRTRDTAGHWSHWSAPAEFVTGAPLPGNLDTDLVISEIMYNPPQGGDAEYVELLNISTNAPLDLTGVRFTAGVDFAFPGGTLLAPTSRVLVVRNTTVFESLHGTGLPVAGVYSNALDNAGETLTLSLGLDHVLRTIPFNDAFPWPAGTDGEGASLVLIGPETNPDHTDPLNWRASLTPNPGSADVAPDLPFAESHRLSLDAVRFDGGHTVTVQRPLGAGAGPVAVEVSTNLVNWVTIPNSAVTTRLAAGGAETLAFDLPAWVPPSSRGYVRVRYTR